MFQPQAISNLLPTTNLSHPILPPHIYLPFSPVLPPHIYPLPSMMEMNQQPFFIPSVQGSPSIHQQYSTATPAGFYSFHGHMHAGMYYPAPQATQHSRSLLSKKKRSLIRIQDPSQNGRDIAKELLLGGRATAPLTPPPCEGVQAGSMNVPQAPAADVLLFDGHVKLSDSAAPGIISPPVSEPEPEPSSRLQSLSPEQNENFSDASSPAPLAPKELTWGDIMEAEDAELEKIRSEDPNENGQDVTEKLLLGGRTTSPLTPPSCEGVQAGSINTPLAPPVPTSPPVSEHEPESASHLQFQHSVQSKGIVSEAPPSTPSAPAKLTWGDIMDAEDAGLENVEPFCLHNSWSMSTINQVAEQKVEEQKEQAKVQQLRVRAKKLPKERLSKNTKTVKLLLKNLDFSVDDRRLHEEFLPFGTVISAKVMMENGCSRGTGFVSFSSPDEARKAIMEMNGRLLGSRPVYVSPAQSKGEHGGRHGERTESSRPTEPCPNPHKAKQNIQPQPTDAAPELRREKQQHKNTSRAQTTPQPLDAQRVILFVKNLDYSMDDRHLHEEFLPFGTVISAKVMMENGRSRGIGFVRYSSPDEATKAMKEMNGKMLGRRPLYVTLAKNNEQCKASLAWTEQWTGSSRPTKPHPRPHRAKQRVQPQRHTSVALATR